MQSPEDRELEARLRDPAFTSFDSLENASIEPIERVPPAYKDEPLFNKTAMLGWAIATAVVWFAFNFVVPIAVESAKIAIRESVKEAETKDGQTVIITRDGHRITITRTPPSVEVDRPSGANSPVATPAPPPAPHDPLNPSQGPAELESHRK